MSALRQSFLSPTVPGWLALVTALLCTSWAKSTQADTFRLSYDATEADPAETFDEDCLGDAPAEDCDTRASLIEGELVTLLSRLESDEAPETLALFQAALELDSPVVQAMALRYLARAEEQPDDFLSKMKTFLFGPDAALGVASAEALQVSTTESDQRLAELYSEQRPVSAYASRPVTDEHDESELLKACIQDARLERMASFSEAERFTPAERLLMYDRFVSATFTPGEDYPATAFVTDASTEEVKAFFTERFGEPYGPVANSQQRLSELTVQLAAVQSAAANGDKAAIKELQVIVEELTRTQQVASLDAYLQLSAIHAENDLVWIEGSIDDVILQVPRAVTVGEDPLLGQTVIRYINAPPSELGEIPGNGGGGNSGGQAGAASGSGNAPGQGGADSEGGANSSGGSPSASSESGCGCTVPGSPGPASSAAALFLLACCVWRARRRSQRAAAACALAGSARRSASARTAP